MSRKFELIERAARFSDRMLRKGPAWDNAHDGYVGGYKAAMRDMRKLVKQRYADNAHHEAPGKRIESRNHCVRVRTEQFLKPIR